MSADDLAADLASRATDLNDVDGTTKWEVYSHFSQNTDFAGHVELFVTVPEGQAAPWETFGEFPVAPHTLNSDGATFRGRTEYFARWECVGDEIARWDAA